MNKKDVLLPVALILAAALVVGGFILLKKHKDSVAPAPIEVVKTAEVEPEEEEPAPPPRRRQRRDINSSINRMVPMQNDQIQGMPTREEAVDAAWDILSAYRESTPEEKYQMAMVMNVASYMLYGISQNANQFIQRMTPEQRDQLVAAAGASRELLDAIQEEMSSNVTPEEVQVFGGVFQSMQYLNESLMDAALF
jgi:flagellar biosynthesis GTPase FlhF